MSTISELLKTYRDLGAIEQRSQDIVKMVGTLSAKIDVLTEKVIKVEMEQKYLRESVKNEIMADIKSDMVQIKILAETIGKNNGSQNGFLGINNS
jgi:hypothetical protein